MMVLLFPKGKERCSRQKSRRLIYKFSYKMGVFLTCEMRKGVKTILYLIMIIIRQFNYIIIFILKINYNNKL